jgi:hypothetical protein
MEIKNFEELREWMAQDLKRVSHQEITPAVANAVANLSGKIIQSIRIEVDYNKMIGSSDEISFIKGKK